MLNKYYIIPITFSIGLATTAFFPLITIGLSINKGFLTIISINSFGERVLFLNSSIHIFSFFRTKSKGSISNFEIISVSSIFVSGFSRYLITSNFFPEFSINARHFLDF